MPGYNFMSQCRRQKVLRKSGRIGVFVKDSISQHISLIDSESDYIMWFKLSKTFFKAEVDPSFGVVYLPPTDSRMDGWVRVFPSTVFQSFRDDGKVNMKGSVQWSAV